MLENGNGNGGVDARAARVAGADPAPGRGLRARSRSPIRAFALALALPACTDSGTPLPESQLAVNIAPLSLPGVTDACYAIEVFAGADPATGTLVLSRAHICASRFGDDEGSIGFVGACDASGTGASSVRLVLEDLCQNGDCPATAGGANSIPASEWRNPCAGPGGCVQTASCLPNSDTPVSFDLTIARAANQGFFDVAVTFDDLFCSAKADCRDGDGPLELLHDPADETRKQTAVVAWACTGGPGADTVLYQDNVVLRCFDGVGAPIGAWAYDPSLGPGNIGPGQAPFVFQAATYRDVQDDTGVASWAMAFGIDVSDLPGRCVLEARATASDGALPDYTTKGVYPYVEWSVELSSGVDTLSCTTHRMDVAGSGVRTTYASAPRAFSHAMRAQGQAMQRRGATPCSDTIAAVDGRAAFTVSPEGMTARVGGSQSPFYALPSGWQLQGCCGDPCCE